MSLIALTYNDGVPFIIGDILISSPGPQGNTPLPTFFEGVEGYLPDNRSYSPIELRQKTYIIGDYLAIALAGYVFEMEIFLGEIKNNFKYRECTYANVRSFLNDYSWETEFANSSLLLLFNDGKVFNTYRRGPCLISLSTTFGKLFASGSGAETFMTMASKAVDPPFPKELDALSSFYLKGRRNIVLTTKFIVSEKLTLNTLSDLWGAGFELIYFENNKLVKLNNLTHVMMIKDVGNEDERINFKVATINTGKYYNEVLVIDACDFKSKQVKKFFVLPIDFKPSEVDTSAVPSEISFPTNMVCISYIFDYRDKQFSIVTYLVYNTESKRTISINTVDNFIL